MARFLTIFSCVCSASKCLGLDGRRRQWLTWLQPAFLLWRFLWYHTEQITQVRVVARSTSLTEFNSEFCTFHRVKLVSELMTRLTWNLWNEWRYRLFVFEGFIAGRVILGTLGKMFITTSFNAVYIFSAELFPTVVRWDLKEMNLWRVIIRD